MTSLQKAKSDVDASTQQASLSASGMHFHIQRPSLWTAFWAVVAAAIPLMKTQNVYGIGQVPLQRIAFVVLIALVVSAMLGHVARPVGLPVWLIGALLIPFAGFISGQNSSLTMSLAVAIQFVILVVLAPAVFRYHVENTSHLVPWVSGAFLAAQTLSATIGLLQVTGVQTEFFSSAINGRASGLAGHPNALGIMSVIALLTAVALLGKAVRLVRALLWCVAAINLSALVATGSLSAIFAAAVGIVVFLIGRRRVLLGIILGVSVWAAGTLIGFTNAGFVSFLEYRLQVVTGAARVGGDASLDARFLTYDWALNHISRDAIAGVGMDDLNAGTYNGVTEVHNYLLHAWYQGGILLAVWFLAATVMIAIVIVRAMAYRQSVGAAAVGAALIAFAATSAFFVQQQYWLPLLFALALLPHKKPVESVLHPGNAVRRNPPILHNQP